MAVEVAALMQATSALTRGMEHGTMSTGRTGGGSFCNGFGILISDAALGPMPLTCEELNSICSFSIFSLLFLRLRCFCEEKGR